MDCVNIFDDGNIHCEGRFSNSNGENHSSFSILMNVQEEWCNACCDYCCCHPLPKGSSIDLYSTFKKDWPKMIEKIKSCPLYKGPDNIHFDIWGGEPLFNFNALKETVATLRKEWPKCALTISTNGLLIGTKHIVDYLLDNNIEIQLSHDGWGQWIRTKEFDPLEDEKCIEGFKRISDAKLFSAVNCTLSYYNYSWYKNIDYFISHLKKNNINPGYIKLNHIYNSTYDIEAINTKGHWQDGYDEKLKGTKIGDVALRGRILDDYLQEFFTLALFFRRNSNTHSPLEWFRSYIMEQSQRYGTIDETKMPAGSCRAFQSWKHNIEGNYKQDWTFVINTSGEYSECNLCNKVDDPGSPMTEECKSCKYKDQKECHGCGSMKRPEKCEYLYKWCQTLEKLYLIDHNGVIKK